MMRMLFVLVLFILPASAVAFIASETNISEPYEIVPIEVTMPEQISFLGTLSDFPVMYEIRSEEPFTFTAQLAQPVNQVAQPFSMLLIRTNDRGGGVTEVARQVYVAQDWATRRDSLLGLSLHESPILSQDVGPGTYRLEVSSPDNQGQYMFTVGTEQSSVWYFEQLGYIRQTQVHFGYGLFSLLKSSQVYYAIGIILLLLAIFQTGRFARKQHRYD